MVEVRIRIYLGFGSVIFVPLKDTLHHQANLEAYLSGGIYFFLW